MTETLARDALAMVSTADQLAIRASDLMVQRLGEPTIESPMTRLLRDRASSVHYVHESDRVLLDDTVGMAVDRGDPVGALPSFEPGGPRERLYFDPRTTRVGIVTCGGGDGRYPQPPRHLDPVRPRW
jgi:6-phosphofructokinase 1